MSGPPPPQGPPPGQQIIQEHVPPPPEVLAIASFLKNADLKPRTSILSGKRVDMFKVKRAIRALQSDQYKNLSSKKGSLLPPVTNRAEAENIFLHMPRHMLALRVQKLDPEAEDPAHAGHGHGKTKRVKGQWNVQIVGQQAAGDEMYYVWLYEGPQWKRTIIGVGVLICLLGVVMFPLWPAFLKLGVWYLSMGMLGLLGLFFAMAIFRLILFVVTMFAVPPGLWLYPNLFEDVGFFDSFRPVWAWEQVKGKKAKKAKKAKHDHSHDHDHKHSHSTTGAPPATGTDATASKSSPNSTLTNRNLKPRIEEVEDE